MAAARTDGASRPRRGFLAHLDVDGGSGHLTKYAGWDRAIPLLDRNGNNTSFAADLERQGTKLDPLLTPESLAERHAEARRCVEHLADAIAAAELDALIVVGDDQHELFLPDNTPALLVYYGETIPALPDRPGDYVKKPMQECTGEEITQEWLYHLGVPVEEMPELAAKGARTLPTMMSYITAFFMPRQAGDRPEVVPEGAVNFAFIGQFAESKQRDFIFTTEYSVRTPMEAVYTLMDVERGVPEVFNSPYDIRTLLAAVAPLRDGKGINVPGPAFLRKMLMKKLEGTEIAKLLEAYDLISKESAKNMQAR